DTALTMTRRNATGNCASSASVVGNVSRCASTQAAISSGGSGNQPHDDISLSVGGFSRRYPLPSRSIFTFHNSLSPNREARILWSLRKARIVASHTLPASVSIDKNVGKARPPRGPAILGVHADASNVRRLAVYVNV